MEIAERDVESVFFNAVDTRRQPWCCLVLGSVVFLSAGKTPDALFKSEAEQ